MLTIEGLLTVLGYTFTVFALGYAIGYNHHKKRLFHKVYSASLLNTDYCFSSIYSSKAVYSRRYDPRFSSLTSA